MKCFPADAARCVPSERPAAVLHAWVAYLSQVESDAIYYRPEGSTTDERAEADRLALQGDEAWNRAQALSVDADALWRLAVDRFRGVS